LNVENRKSRAVLLAVALTLLAGLAAWRFVAVGWLTRLPDDFHYEADLYSRDEFFDEVEGHFHEEVLSHSRFAYEVLALARDVATIGNDFEVHKPTGENTISIQRKYSIDRQTWQHLPGSGDRPRTGFLFAPRGVSGQPFQYWHVNYDAPATMIFQDEEEILGLRVLRYTCDYTADQTANLGHLAGVPSDRGVNVDVHLELWVEPASGWLVQYQDRATAYFYDARSHVRLHPWNRFRNEYTKASVAEQVDRGRAARRRAQWAGAWGVTLWILLALTVGVVAVLVHLRPTRARLRRVLGALDWLLNGLSRWSATAVVLLGLTVSIGWLAGSHRVVQIVPGFVAMQFSTALGFFVVGIGFWAQLSGWRRLGCALASAVVLLGALVLVHRWLALDPRLERIWDRALLPLQVQLPGRMAPYSALCFILAGTAV
jgi:hypothetical protein